MTSSMLPTNPAMREPRSFPEYDKIPKFRKLEVEEDVEANFGVYEAHTDSYGVPQGSGVNT